MKITHIINPVKVKESSDLFKAQPITFETMRKAKEFAKEVVDVDLITTQYAEDRDFIPDYFYKTKDLDRSVLDVGDFKIKRKLPLIKDILNRAVHFNTNADYIIYTNVDIALMPHFYLFVGKKIKEGYDAFIINRRTVSKSYTAETLSAAYCDYGSKHPGYDCFVFKKELLPKFIYENTCIGANFIGRVMYSNLFVFCNKLAIIKDAHLTFHIGEDGAWLTNNYSEFDVHNKNEALKVIKELIPQNTDEDKIQVLKTMVNFINDYGKESNKVAIKRKKFSSKFKKIIKIILE